MQGQYRGNRGVRPRGVCGSEHEDDLPAWLFLCADCRVQAVICSVCDRGQIYCAGDCAPQARRRTVRAAERRYQTSRRGWHPQGQPPPQGHAGRDGHLRFTDQGQLPA